MPQDKSRLSLPDVKHLLTAGGLVAGTLGTLLLGAVLQVDTQAVAAEPPRQGSSPPVAGGFVEPPRAATRTDRTAPAAEPRTPAAEPRKPAAPPRSVRPVPADHSGDAHRLKASGGDWTLQFMVTCNAEFARQLVQDVGGDERLYLLPVTHDGRACLRICWGAFPTRDGARGTNDIPAPLRKLTAEPMARSVADVVS